MELASPPLPQIAADGPLTLAQARCVVQGDARLAPGAEALRRCAAAHARLSRVVEENRHVYGLTTGFGPLANRLVPAGQGALLQQNLVFHLASGVGPMLGWEEGRAVALARLLSILRGASGASKDAIDALVTLVNSDLAPELPARGTVGASGDLTPLAHMVLCLQGRGAFIARNGARLEGPEGLARLGRAPLSLHRRDGLALVNGTSAMTGLAVLSAGRAGRAIAWSLSLTAALAEALHGRLEAWHPAFSALRPHPGQGAAAVALRSAVAGSERCHTRPIAARRLAPGQAGAEAEPGQDAYTLRCAPQVIGAVLDTAAWHDTVAERELNAVTDNPIFPEDAEAPALHGGNFMGQHIALASDALSNAVLVLAGLAERQIARLTDESLNRGLPAFLHRGPCGLNSGFMGAQVTATALLSEMRARGGAASVHSISTNGANQDVVSLGTVAARHLQERLADLGLIQAILALALAQAAELRMEDGSGRAFSPCARALVAALRRIAPPLEEDRPLGPEIEATAAFLSAQDPPRPP